MKRPWLVAGIKGINWGYTEKTQNEIGTLVNKQKTVGGIGLGEIALIPDFGQLVPQRPQ